MAWKLRIATQVPAQLVGLAAACERRWKLGWCGPGSGPAVVFGEGLAGWPGKGLVVARCRPRQGSCRGSCGFPRQESCRGSLPSNPHLILNILCLHKDLHATMEVPPEPWLNVVDGVGDHGFEGGSLHWCGRAAPARGLPGLLRLPPQGSCRGNLLRPSALCGFGLLHCADRSCAFDSSLLPC